MIIQRMRATFGKLDGQELRLQPGLNVISGGNETGKTTWLAFLLAMLYGVDSRDRIRGDRLPDKLKYQPWSGKPMAGTMELTDGERAITLERTSQNAPMGDFRAWDSKTGTPVEDLTGKTCGQTLLGVESTVYARSGYLRQQRVSVSADAQLEKRLSGLVTSGSEDYSFVEIDEKLKKLQTAIRHNQTGALPKAEETRRSITQRLTEIEDSHRRLAELETDLNDLRTQREEVREILAGLDALEQQHRRERVATAEASLAEAAEDREGWEAVCADLPAEEVLQNLEAELQQLQSDLERAALEEGLSISELDLPEPDPIFGRMGPREAHDKAAADATTVQTARNAKRPRRSRLSPFLLLLILAGLGIGFAGAMLTMLPLVIAGLALALGGLVWWLGLRISFNRKKEAYIELQRAARAVLEQYEATSAKGVVLRGISYIRGIEEQEREAEESGADHGVLAELADRRNDLMNRLSALMPGCDTFEKAAILFQEAGKSRASLAQARLLEEQQSKQLEALRLAVGEAERSGEDVQRFAAYDRETEETRLKALDSRIDDAASQAAMMAGAIGQMGDPIALNAELEQLDREICGLEDRYAALRLARRALAEADESLRARFAPVLCEKTGAFLLRLTGGKYDQIQLDRSMHITVHPTDSPVFRPLSYLSGGTVDQLYLALRLAICELLIPGAPIVLDDALVYFDDNRAALALETLRELSKTRQILIFTCQSREKRILNELAKKAQENAKAQPEPVS